MVKVGQPVRVNNHSTFPFQTLLFAALLGLATAVPLEGFGDATDEEIAQIRAGTYLEMFDENPTYNYNYKVADNAEQTYVSLEEARNDGVVTGSYSYVDPYVSRPRPVDTP